MNLIVAVDNNWAIGYKNKLLVSIPADLKMFQEKTTGKIVVLGRKTLETFPYRMPLKNRTNIILSTNSDYQVGNAIVVHSRGDLLKELRQYKSSDIYIIGGESIYRMMLPYCDIAYVTKINHAYEADSYFPNLDQDQEWKITSNNKKQIYANITYRFEKYERKKRYEDM